MATKKKTTKKKKIKINTPQIGDEVSVRHDGSYYEFGMQYHDAEIITDIIDGIVYICDDYTRGFSIEDGTERTDNQGRSLQLIFDNGYAAQHFEDLSLGEGDTL